MNRTIATAAAVPAAALITLAVAAPASAHVSVTPSTAEAGAYTVVTVSVPHGCDGSPTTAVAVQIPEDVLSVTPTRNPLYTLEKVQEQLAEPVQGAHGEITERTAQVVYTATTPLPDGERDTFELSLQIPEDAAGETLTFPTIQTCEQGEAAWTEVPAAGQSEDDLERPAPAFEVAEAGAGTDTVALTSSPATVEEDGNALGVAGLVAGLLGLALGGLALARTRRT